MTHAEHVRHPALARPWWERGDCPNCGGIPCESIGEGVMLCERCAAIAAEAPGYATLLLQALLVGRTAGPPPFPGGKS